MCNFEHPVLSWDMDRVASLLMSGYGVSNIAHNCDIYSGNMQLKMKEIFLWSWCGIGGKKIYVDCII